VLLLAPLLLGAVDPASDLVSCQSGSPLVSDAPIDMVKASGTSAENGLALRFTIGFSAPLPVPDEEGSPLRVDVLLREGSVPDLSADYYRGLNRIVRFDAVADPGLLVLLLPEKAESPFTGGVRARGDTLTLTLPARMVMQDPDIAGFDLSDLRWTVVSRDEDTCDLLGERARPERRVRVLGGAASPVPPISPNGPPPAATADPLISAGFLVACLVAITIGGGVGFAAAAWRRREG
jgi:hypothetical protein